MFTNYIKYLEFLNSNLSDFFENQKEYICCQKGCSLCCEKGEYPYSQIEIAYLLEGFKKLDINLQKQINENINKVLEEKKLAQNEKFMYKCPFLTGNNCSVYDYRGIVCRTFGLIENAENDRTKIPFCAYEGLNYSKILDKNIKQLSSEKYKNLGLKQIPTGFNIGYKFLTNEKIEKIFQFYFGEKKPLIDWLIK